MAAEKRLRTAQPSLSRQMRDLEFEVGAQIMTRNARGIELTPAERTFLDHARLAPVEQKPRCRPRQDAGSADRPKGTRECAARCREGGSRRAARRSNSFARAAWRHCRRGTPRNAKNSEL